MMNLSPWVDKEPWFLVKLIDYHNLEVDILPSRFSLGYSIYFCLVGKGFLFQAIKCLIFILAYFPNIYIYTYTSLFYPICWSFQL